MGRAPCCDKSTVKKGPWSPEEDTKLKDFIHQHGTGGNWIALPHKAGLKRCGKSCRLRWLNYLRPDIKHGEFSDEEDRIICNLFSTIGSRWSIIAAHLQGRTDNDIKNYWNTKLKKKLFNGMQQPTSHRIRHTCGASPPLEHFPPPISSPLTKLYLHNSSGFSYNCNTFPFTEALVPANGSSVLVHGGGGYAGLPPQAPPQTAGAWWDGPLEYGLEDIKEQIINGGDGRERVKEGGENKGKEEYL